MKRIFLLLVLFVATNAMLAQDIIVKTDSTKVEAKITEISDFEIKYYDWSNPTGPLYIVAVDKIAYIKFANGKVTNYTDHVNSLSTDVDAAAINKKNIIKVSPFSPITGHLDFEYERVFSKRMSCVTEFGIIGVNASEYLDKGRYGAFAAGGVRLYKGQEVREKNTYYNNNFTGLYAQAKLGLEYYNYDFEYATYQGTNYITKSENVNVVGGSVMLGIGKQWVFGGKLTIDVGGGLGYVFVNKLTYTTEDYGWNDESDTNTYTVTHSLNHAGNFGNDIGLAGDGWLRVGLIF